MQDRSSALWKVYSFPVTQLSRHWIYRASRNTGGCGPGLRLGGDRYTDLCFPASSAIRGPGAVRGPVGGSLTVQCHYDPGWEKYVKWWCRGAAWGSCNILVKTTGSEHKVKMNHVSIGDDQMNRVFTVTLEELRWSDADTYWCGIEKIAGDLGVQVKVAVDPGKNMCMCGHVSSGPALSRPLRSLSRDLTVTQSEPSQSGLGPESCGSLTGGLGLSVDALTAPGPPPGWGQAFLGTCVSLHT